MQNELFLMQKKVFYLFPIVQILLFQIHYLLEDDYEEVGYVCIRSPGDGHIMSYIYHDGLYYLIDSAQYGIRNPADWLESFPAVLGCSDDFRGCDVSGCYRCAR